MKQEKKRGGILGKLLLGVVCLLLGIGAAVLVMFSTLKKADAAFARGEIAEAEALAEKAGSFGTERLLRYRRGEAEALLKQGQYAEAAGLCEELGDLGSDTWCAALKAMTLQALEAENAPAAMELMETWLEGRAEADVTAEAWRASRLMLRSGDYELLPRALELSGETETAGTERSFLELLENGSYVSALELLRRGELGEAQPDWERFYMARLDSECRELPDARLQELAVRRQLEKQPLSVPTAREPGRGEESLRMVENRGLSLAPVFASRGSGVEPVENDMNSGVIDVDALLSSCKGTKPGSVLVLWQQQVYEREREAPAWRSALALDFQRCVEEAYCPHSVEEADYLILLTFSYENDGWYSNNHVEGLREYTTVRALSHDGRELYCSERIAGPIAPDTFTYYELPEYLTGGAPNCDWLTKLLHEALIAVYGEPEENE